MALGVHSEVGVLHKVMVHRPGLEHTRLTPSNAEDLLFDDVLWVAQAKREHDAFKELMRERGVEPFGMLGGGQPAGGQRVIAGGGDLRQHRSLGELPGVLGQKGVGVRGGDGALLGGTEAQVGSRHVGGHHERGCLQVSG